MKTLPGISAPFENIFDPADLIGRADGSVRPVQEIKRWREAEITHGRVSMLAALVHFLSKLSVIDLYQHKASHLLMLAGSAVICMSNVPHAALVQCAPMC